MLNNYVMLKLTGDYLTLLSTEIPPPPPLRLSTRRCIFSFIQYFVPCIVHNKTKITVSSHKNIA